MALREVVVTNSITVYPAGQIVVDKSVSIFRDNTEVTKEQQTPTYNPGDDVSGEEQRVRDIAGIVWTDALVQKYQQDTQSTVVDFQE